MSSSRKNSWIILTQAFTSFFISVWMSVISLFSGRDRDTESFPLLSRILYEGPADFRSRPTAIRAGRALFTLLLSFFSYDTNSPK